MACTGLFCGVPAGESQQEVQVRRNLPKNAPATAEAEAACKIIIDKEERQNCIFSLIESHFRILFEVFLYI